MGELVNTGSPILNQNKKEVFIMPIYQIKLKGNDDYVHSYHTFLAQDVQDAIKQATEQEKHTIEEIIRGKSAAL